MTILNSYADKVEANAGSVFLFDVFIVFAFIFLIIAIEAFKYRDKKAGTIFTVFCVASFIMVSIALIDIFTRPKVTTYEVILSDDYSATELLKNYDLVEQRGEIWVIQEKEEVQNGK